MLAIPFMDRDGVEDGDQGKNRTPHDHNRDYNERPLYPEVSALMKLGESLKPRVLVATDLHCPHIRGEWNDRVYLVGVTILHELTHWGDDQDGVDRPGEEGEEFEIKVYGKVIN